MSSREYRKKRLFKATFSTAFFSIGFGVVSLVFYLAWRSYTELWSGCLMVCIISLFLFIVFLVNLIAHIKRTD